ncbi:MAG: hypothetical protein AAFP02_04890 [Bacteroidota bacterium]
MQNGRFWTEFAGIWTEFAGQLEVTMGGDKAMPFRYGIWRSAKQLIP